MSILDTLAALCGPDQAARGVLLLPALLLAGLAGSVAHCTAMCGPFVLGQVADGLARVPAARMCQATRLRGAMLLPYHAGRITTYGALGVAAGWLGGVRLTELLPPLLPALFLGLAAVGFLLLALQRARPGLVLAGFGSGRGGAVAAFAGRVARLRGLRLGLALGLLPCGMVYAALAASASVGALLGGLGMIAFGLGTVPALVVVGLLGHAAARRWQAAADRAAPWVLAGNGLLLLALAWQAAAWQAAAWQAAAAG